jgi:hypothetical protein
MKFSRVQSLLAVTVVALIAGPVFASLVSARPTSDVKSQDVMRVLEYKGDPQPADFKECGSGVDSVLVDILSGRRVKTEIRVRAARALSWYKGSRSRMVLTSTMTTPDEDVDVRAACMSALARLIGFEAIDDLKPWLKDKAPTIRAGAATALAVVGGPKARQILLDTIAHETNLEVRMLMDEALNRMGKTDK